MYIYIYIYMPPIKRYLFRKNMYFIPSIAAPRIKLERHLQLVCQRTWSASRILCQCRRLWDPRTVLWLTCLSQILYGKECWFTLSLFIIAYIPKQCGDICYIPPHMEKSLASLWPTWTPTWNPSRTSNSLCKPWSGSCNPTAMQMQRSPLTASRIYLTWNIHQPT